MSKQASFIVFLFFILSGCAQDEIYRSDISECVVTATNKCGTYSFQHRKDKVGNEYSLAIVEIDDQGQLPKRGQLDFMIDKLKSDEPALIIVYVHGWHHNAHGATDDENEDPNIQDFGDQLAAISLREKEDSKKKDSKPRPVFGVYIGWRGDSIELEGLNIATFWDRKNTAEEVGHLALTEILLRLEDIRDKKPRSRLVVVGHSFGGAAVYRATAQIFADRFVKKHDNGNHSDLSNSHEGFGDLVVLINPAFEALRYAPLYEIAQSDCIDNPDQKPILAILTSEGDSATGFWFRVGRFLNTRLETHNDIKRTFCDGKWGEYNLAEAVADRTTVGHFKLFFTHTLKPLKEETPETKESSTMYSLDFEPTSDRWKNTTGEIKFDELNLVFNHLGKTNLHNPYLNIRVSKKIVEGHNDIFKPEITGFITSLIGYTLGDEK